MPPTPAPPPSLRRTRIVCISDTHSSTFPTLPSGDILIHAGNLTTTGTYSELQQTLTWLSSTSFKLKLIIAGNQDVTLDRPFYQSYGSYFHAQQPQDADACIKLLTSEHKYPSITYLNHEARTVYLQHPDDGTITRLKVFGSPYSPSRGLWAFGYAAEDAAAKWKDIPLDADIVITHTPPKFHCDESSVRGAAGCEDLRRALWRVRPRMAVCGHVYEGRGVESVLWDLGVPNVRYKEVETFYWNDVSKGRRDFRVDLTGSSVRPLRNDGSKRRLVSTLAIMNARGREVSPEEEGGGSADRAPGGVGKSQQDGAQPAEENANATKPFPQSELAERPISPVAGPRPVHPSTHGLGGLPVTGRCDFEALAGREGRKETCIVNAAVGGPGKMCNKPIVIDLELPTMKSKFKGEGLVSTLGDLR